MSGAFVTAGRATITPIWAYELGKEADGKKGAKIDVSGTYVRVNEFSRPDIGASVLDLDELRDLQTALNYFAANRVLLKYGDDETVQMRFFSKDDLQVTSFRNDKGMNIMTIESGRASVNLTEAASPQLLSAVNAAISRLDAATK